MYLSDRKFSGPGGPPPPPSYNNDSSDKTFERNPFYFYELFGDKELQIKPFYIYYGERKNVVMLDKGNDSYSIMVHARFFYNKKFDNYAICRAKVDSKGCPLCDQVGDPSWFTVKTLIDRSVFVPKDGQNKGKEYTDFRRLLLIPRACIETFFELEDDPEEGVNGDWRGMIVKVRRASKESNNKSPRIGGSWSPRSRMSEEDMITAFESIATEKEVPVENYISPVNYDEVFNPYDYESMLSLAEELKNHVAPPSKWDKGNNKAKTASSSKAKTVSSSKAKGYNEADDDVPF